MSTFILNLGSIQIIQLSNLLIIELSQYSSMDKQLQQTLAKVTMYSKMGRYISNKILKYNKHSKSQRSLRGIQICKEDYLRIKKQKSKDKHVSQSQHSSHSSKGMMSMTQPPVGYYKIKYNQIEKNPRVYDFNRSVPHFNREKFHCHQSEPAYNDYPDSSLCQHRVTGFKELKRMPARTDIKGSVRKQIEDPHQKRFEYTQDFRLKDVRRTRVNMSKDLARNGAAFATTSNGPQFQYDTKVPLKRLDTHIIPFQRILDRNSKFMVDQKGISNYFSDFQLSEQQKLQCWKKMLPRQRTGLLPSYMDKNINTRSSISLLNLKTLQMNCTKLKQPFMKTHQKKKSKLVFIEETDKENTNI